MFLTTEYTTILPLTDLNMFRTLPGNLFFEYESKEVSEITAPSANVFSRIFIEFPFSSYPATYQESFIGILTDDEAREMKERISLFKKSFDDDLARRNKILFGE